MTPHGMREMIRTQPERQTRTVGLAMKQALALAEARENCPLRKDNRCSKSCTNCNPQ